MAVFCITSSNPEFQKLLAESGQKPLVFEMMVSKWMTNNEIYDRYPTLQELGITTVESVKPGVEELFNENPELANQVYEALGFKTKPDVILPIGTSGSGKSTFIKSLPQKDLVVIEPDAMRVEFTGDINNKSKDKEIYEEAAKRAVKAIKQGKQVVFDTTNLTKDKRLPFIEAIKKALPNANIQYKLMELNPELAKQRIKAQIARGENRANVPDATIDRHAESYKQMLKDIKSEPISNFEITPQQKQQALQQYSAYLNSIFPNSKVKDIVYHNTDAIIEKFQSIPVAKFFTKSSLGGKKYRLPILLSITNPKVFSEFTEDDEMTYGLAEMYARNKEKDGIINGTEGETRTEYIVFEPEQIHILGSNNDIEGFREFVGSVENRATESGLSLSNDEAAAYNSLVNDGTIPIKCE